MSRLYNKINKEILKQRINQSNEVRTTLSFYQYHHIENPESFRDELYIMFYELGVFGRIYIAEEGINAQISVPNNNFTEFKNRLFNIPFLQNVRLNIAIEDDGKSFYLLKIKVKQKIVADGLEDDRFDVTNSAEHLSAQDFNTLVDAEPAAIVDMRNHYESEVGHFKNAICPDVDTFREALHEVTDILKEQKEKAIIMYCTGGIRCEKAGAYLKYKGFSRVYQLDGGIIEYARQVRELGIENKFIGKNFVFDERLGERISDDVIAQCHQCGEPSDDHANCANNACHILFVQCTNCAKKYNNCCSQKCQDFNELPEEVRKNERLKIEFNGTKFGKGRYKAHRTSNSLN